MFNRTQNFRFAFIAFVNFKKIFNWSMAYQTLLKSLQSPKLKI